MLEKKGKAVPERKTLDASQLERMAVVALRAARILTECGARAKIAHEALLRLAKGFGVLCVGSRTGYASLALSLATADGATTVTRVATIERYGVNHRLDMAVRALVARAEKGELALEAFEAELEKAVSTNRRHPAWLVALAVGLACASFGRLFGVDWPAFLPVFLAGSLGQFTRHHLVHRSVNAFVVAALIAFLDATLAGLGARLMGSGTVNLAMMASILLLVPGVPATNAQMDIMDGYPTLGSARAVTVLMIMVFATAGIWMAQSLLGVHG